MELTKTKRMVTRAFTTRLTKQQRMVTKSIHKTTRKMILQTQMITEDKEVNEATNQNARIATAKRRNPNYGDQRSRSPRGLYNINSYLRKYAYHGKINGSIDYDEERNCQITEPRSKELLKDCNKSGHTIETYEESS